MANHTCTGLWTSGVLPPGGSGGSGSYTIAAGGSGGGSPTIYTTNNTNTVNPYVINNSGNTPGITVKGDAEFDGNVKIKGRDVSKLFEKIEDRLAILMEPDPAKLEKFVALKKAYDHYKLLEKLIGDE
jgi:hypothetical protein